MRSTWFVFTLLLATVPAARSEEPAWKLEKPYFVEYKNEKTTETTGLGPDSTEKTTMHIAYTVTPRKTDKGELVLEHKFLHFSGKMNPQTVAMFEKTVDSSVDIVYGTDMVLRRIEGVPKLVETSMGNKYADLPKPTVKLLESAFDAVVKGSTQDCYFPLPTGKHGSKNVSNLAVGGIIEFDLTRNYESAKARDDGLLEYAFKGGMKLKAGEGESPIPGLKVLSADLKDGSTYGGTVTFDPTLGRPTKVVHESTAAVEMKMSVGGNEIAGVSSEKQKTTITFSDEKPKIKKD